MSDVDVWKSSLKERLHSKMKNIDRIEIYDTSDQKLSYKNKHKLDKILLISRQR